MGFFDRFRKQQADELESDDNFVEDSAEDSVEAGASHVWAADNDEDSAFDTEAIENDFFADKQAGHNRMMAEYGDLPSVEVRNRKIQDVLSLMEIKSTFAIESDLFMPEDLQDIQFDLQTPYGFEQGQVSNFVERTRATVIRYVDLLRQRNEDVAKLASLIDKLQVDANNLKYDAEVATGISVMVSDDDDYESMYQEEVLKVRRLEDTIRDLQRQGGITDTERERYEALQDNYAVLSRENEDLKTELASVTQRVYELEELEEIPGTTERFVQDEFTGEYDEIDDDLNDYLPLPGSKTDTDGDDSLPSPNCTGHSGSKYDDLSLPAPVDELPGVLPEFSEEADELPGVEYLEEDVDSLPSGFDSQFDSWGAEPVDSNDAFADVSDDDPDPMAALKGRGTEMDFQPITDYGDYDDDNDELDDLMSAWSQK